MTIIGQDFGDTVLEALYAELMVDAQWSLRRERSFVWWSYRLAQTVSVSKEQWDGKRKWVYVRIHTDLVHGVDPGADPAEVVAVINQQQSLSATIWSEEAGWVSECCAATVTDETFHWMTKLLATAALLQNTAAHSRAHAVAEALGGQVSVSDHPTNGQRPTMDDLLNFPVDVVTALGADDSAYADGRLQRVHPWILEQGLLGTGDATDLTVEVPYTGWRPAFEVIAAGEPIETSLVTISTRERHPQYGAGVLILMRLPVNAEDPAALANQLNLVEFTGRELGPRVGNDDGAPLLGAWCPAAETNTDVVFVSFYPNAIEQVVLPENLILNQLSQSLAARELLEQ